MKALNQSKTASPDDWGRIFVIMPRKALEDLNSPVKKIKERALVMTHLISLAFFADGHRYLKNKQVTCLRGEAIITYRKLEEYTGFNYSKLRRMVQKLAEEKYLSVEKVEGVSKIRLIRYEKFLRQIHSKERKQPASSPVTHRKSTDIAREQFLKNLELLQSLMNA